MSQVILFNEIHFSHVGLQEAFHPVWKSLDLDAGKVKILRQAKPSFLAGRREERKRERESCVKGGLGSLHPLACLACAFDCMYVGT